jgi:hypothetical protein
MYIITLYHSVKTDNRYIFRYRQFCEYLKYFVRLLLLDRLFSFQRTERNGLSVEGSSRFSLFKIAGKSHTRRKV